MNSVSDMRSHSSYAQGDLGNLLTFLIPCLIFVEITIVGRLFLSELILAMLFPVLLIVRGRSLLNRLPLTFIILGLIWLLSQILTDVIRAIPFLDYARGWSKIVFLLLNFSAIYLLLHNKKRRLMLFALGIAVGRILQFFIAPNIYAVEGHVWKFGVGFAVTFLLILSTQWRKMAQIPFSSEMIVISAAMLNFFLGFRSLGAFCFATVLYLFYQRYAKSGKRCAGSDSCSVKTLIGALCFGSCAIILVGALYGYAASAGWLGEDAKEKYEWQASGKYGFLLGGRPEILVSSIAIMDSPVIGHGSWAKDPNYAIFLVEQLSQQDYEIGAELDSDLIPTHSYLLGAWVESGVFGAVFWVWVLILSAKLLISMRSLKTQLTVLLAFIAFNMIWNILFSPLGAESRIYAAYYVVVLMYGTILVYSRHATTPSTIQAN